MENKKDYSSYGATILRLVLGLLFIIPGLEKLSDPSKIIGMLGSMGIPSATLMGWVLLLSEIIFGIAVLIGWKVKYTIWPLVIVLLVALSAVHIPNIGQPMGVITVLFHLLGIGGLISLFLTGPGEASLK